MNSSAGITEADIATYLHGPPGDDGPWVPSTVPIEPGRGAADLQLLESGPGPLIIITRIASAGLITEERLLNRPGFEVRCVGEQDDYESARDLAFGVDWLLMSPPVAVLMGGVRVSAVAWVGGGPTLLTRDTALRSHFTCGYVLTVPSGLT